MYERFTESARKVMQLANQEAIRFNHEYMGTEHILLGLIKEGSGVAATVLKGLNIDLCEIRSEVERIIESTPDMVTLGKLPQSPRAKRVIQYSIEEARTLIHDHVGTHHLLLGLLREEEGIAARALTNFGLRLEGTRDKIQDFLKNNKSVNEGEVLPSTGIVASLPTEIVHHPLAPELSRAIQECKLEYVASLPPEIKNHPLARQLIQTVEEFNFQKEWCVAKQQFEEAALLRDQCGALSKYLSQLIQMLNKNPNLGRTQADEASGP
jgi:ATP-dependent Clp protease ATP-binding subunit ClpC